MQIRDASTNRSVDITSTGRIKGCVRSEESANCTNREFGETYTAVVSVTPTGNDDCFFRMKNLSDSNIVVKGINFYSAADTAVYVKIGDTGTAVGGTALVPCNNNAKVGHEADGEFEYGVDITGLSGGTTNQNFFFDGGTSSKYFEFVGDIILQKNATLTFWVSIGGAATIMTVPFYYEETTAV